jgi:hypothetical protein
MTPEHLDLYRQLSETKIYKERFGEWQVGDHGYHIEVKSEFVVVYPEGELLYVYWKGHEQPKDIFRSNALWLPPVFDPENPERCLIGMLNGKSFLIASAKRKGGYSIIVNTYSKPKYFGETLDIAIIKAILGEESRSQK